MTTASNTVTLQLGRLYSSQSKIVLAPQKIINTPYLLEKPGQLPTVVLFFPFPYIQYLCLVPSIATDHQPYPSFPAVHISCGFHGPSSPHLPLPYYQCILASNTSRHTLWTHQLSRPVKESAHSHYTLWKSKEEAETKEQNIHTTKTAQKSAPRPIVIPNPDA